MRKKTSEPKRKTWFSRINIILVMLLAILVGIYVNSDFPSVFNFRNELQDMKQLPPEIKKELQAASPSATFRVPVLLYHYVEYVKDEGDTIRKSLNIMPHIFESQIQTLAAAGFTFMTASDLTDVLDGKRPMPKKPVALTFDDGYRDLYTDVLPILKKHKVRVTAFIVPEFINGPNSMYMWQLKEVASSGLVEIGAHTMHHTYLKGMALSRVEYEVGESKKVLEKELGMPILSFAYPYGAFDKQAIDAVRRAGFRIGISTVPGVEFGQGNRYFVYRIRPGMRTGGELLKYFQQDVFSAY